MQSLASPHASFFLFASAIFDNKLRSFGSVKLRVAAHKVPAGAVGSLSNCLICQIYLFGIPLSEEIFFR